MATALNTPQAVADELLRVDQARRIREAAARREAEQLFRPLDQRRRLLITALNNLSMADVTGAPATAAIEATEHLLNDLQAEIDEAMRQVAIRHRLFADDDATEDFDDVDVDAILPAAEAARRRGGR